MNCVSNGNVTQETNVAKLMFLGTKRHSTADVASVTSIVPTFLNSRFQKMDRPRIHMLSKNPTPMSVVNICRKLQHSPPHLGPRLGVTWLNMSRERQLWHNSLLSDSDLATVNATGLPGNIGKLSNYPWHWRFKDQRDPLTDCVAFRSFSGLLFLLATLNLSQATRDG